MVCLKLRFIQNFSIPPALQYVLGCIGLFLYGIAAAGAGEHSVFPRPGGTAPAAFTADAFPEDFHKFHGLLPAF